MNKEQLYQRVHNWTNEIINEFNPGHGLKKLPAGVIGNDKECVLARAFQIDGLFDDASVEGESIHLKKGEKTINIKTPGEVVAFVEAFDNGKFPELVAGGRAVSPTDESIEDICKHYEACGSETHIRVGNYDPYWGEWSQDRQYVLY